MLSLFYKSALSPTNELFLNELKVYLVKGEMRENELIRVSEEVVLANLGHKLAIHVQGSGSPSAIQKTPGALNKDGIPSVFLLGSRCESIA